MHDCSRITISELQRAGGSQASCSPHWYGGREEGELELAVASVGAAILSRCGQPQPFVSHFIAAFQAMLKQKFVFFCIPPTLPVIYTPPCYSLRNAEFFRKDNSLLWGRKAKL